MTFTKMEKYLIFAFGTEERMNTVKRLGLVCSCTINESIREQVLNLHNKLGELGSEWDGWYAEQFYLIRDEMESIALSYNQFVWGLIAMLEKQS